MQIYFFAASFDHIYQGVINSEHDCISIIIINTLCVQLLNSILYNLIYLIYINTFNITNYFYSISNKSFLI